MKKILASEHLILGFCVLYFGMVAITAPSGVSQGFTSAANFKNILTALLPLLIVAIGQTVVMITGGIDLSVTSTIGLTSIFGAMLMNSHDGWLAGNVLAFPAGVLVMVLSGAAIGLINGLCITFLGMAPFIMTLISWMFIKGFGNWLTKANNIDQLPASFLLLGSPGPAGLITSGLIAVALIVLTHLMLSHTLLGAWIYATGLNPKASFISGVRVKATTCYAYIFCGACAGLSACIYSAQLESGSAKHGEKIMLDIVGAVVIGGTSLFGGKGKVLWTVYGVLFMTLLGNSLNMLELTHFTIMMVKGAVILTAALLDVWRTRWWS